VLCATPPHVYEPRQPPRHPFSSPQLPRGGPARSGRRVRAGSYGCQPCDVLCAWRCLVQPPKRLPQRDPQMLARPRSFKQRRSRGGCHVRGRSYPPTPHAPRAAPSKIPEATWRLRANDHAIGASRRVLLVNVRMLTVCPPRGPRGRASPRPFSALVVALGNASYMGHTQARTTHPRASRGHCS
jgi:hypothetical protein